MDFVLAILIWLVVMSLGIGTIAFVEGALRPAPSRSGCAGREVDPRPARAVSRKGVGAFRPLR